MPFTTEPVHVERTTLAHLDVEAVPDATLQLRAAVDLAIHVGPGGQLAFALTRTQAEELLHSLAAHLGHRVIGVGR